MDETKETQEIYMTEEEIMNLMPSDFRNLTPEEEMRDNFRRMFQIMGSFAHSVGS